VFKAAFAFDAPAFVPAYALSFISELVVDFSVHRLSVDAAMPTLLNGGAHRLAGHSNVVIVASPEVLRPPSNSGDFSQPPACRFVYARGQHRPCGMTTSRGMQCPDCGGLMTMRVKVRRSDHIELVCTVASCRSSEAFALPAQLKSLPNTPLWCYEDLSSPAGFLNVRDFVNPVGAVTAGPSSQTAKGQLSRKKGAQAAKQTQRKGAGTPKSSVL
jgi:hypothetical protein